ncbi:DUF6461 domain-containing protein [Kitasatospora sp. NPDC096147]|uniref:DUF6461 domain-containing protein n=1 Tax=Kitasatospora sp. NPDC096147 TaxID=3364093 RepID=UPI003807102C
MRTATARDYAWIGATPWYAYGMAYGFSLLLARGVTPADLRRVTAAEPQGTCTGTAGLIERQEELLDELDHADEDFVSGLLTLPGDDGASWLLALQFDSGSGMTPDFARALSAGGRAVLHSRNGGKPMDLFHWYEDGELRTAFEAAGTREGSTPDTLLRQLREVGYPFTDEEHLATPVLDAKAAAFALAERLTGVRITEELLRDAGFELVQVPDGYTGDE